MVSNFPVPKVTVSLFRARWSWLATERTGWSCNKSIRGSLSTSPHLRGNCIGLWRIRDRDNPRNAASTMEDPIGSARGRCSGKRSDRKNLGARVASLGHRSQKASSSPNTLRWHFSWDSHKFAAALLGQIASPSTLSGNKTSSSVTAADTTSILICLFPRLPDA